MAYSTSPRSHDFHPLPVQLPQGQHTAASPGETAQMSGSALLSQSESDADEGDFKWGSMEDASVLYSKPQRHKARAMSATILRQRNTYNPDQGLGTRSRRMSHDEQSIRSRKFLIDVEETMKLVLEQEDTDANFQVRAHPLPELLIHAADKGPKVFSLGTASSNGYNSFDIRGTYMLSNLLQELALARDHNQKQIVLDEARLSENPVSRLSRMIRHSFWSNLTRRIDGDGLEKICADPKNRGANQAPRIYVPEREPGMRKYYERIAAAKPHLGLIVDTVPENFDAEWVRDQNEKPGILALAMKETGKTPEGDPDYEGIPFVVPGARFNELYNWDSYFISLGLLADGYVELAKGIVEHFLFEIKHYKKILNGNRSYYLMRSQPPFLTDLALGVFAQLDPSTPEENKAWLKRAMQGAIQEYHMVWQEARRLDEVTGLSRYRPDGLGIPPETEASHFTTVLQPYADELGISVNEFTEQYNSGEVQIPALDEYFLHDRGVRESGHDTTYRFEKRCANLGTIDLCSLLYKYEIDIATVLRDHFDDELELFEEFPLTPFPFGTEVPYTPSEPSLPDLSQPRSSTASKQTSAEWFARAARRKVLADHYLWHEGRGIYTDYDCKKKKQGLYESVTTFWPMWCGMASEAQAEKIMFVVSPSFDPFPHAKAAHADLLRLRRKCSLHKFEVAGGLLSGTESSRGRISLQRPNRQWECVLVFFSPLDGDRSDALTAGSYPAAWPPQSVSFLALTRSVPLTPCFLVPSSSTSAKSWPVSDTLGFSPSPSMPTDTALYSSGVGLQKYGYSHEAQRLAYRWLHMSGANRMHCQRLTVGFVEAGGCVPEKFNAVEGTSNIDAEYGNQVCCIPLSLNASSLTRSARRVPILPSSREKALAGASPRFLRSPALSTECSPARLRILNRTNASYQVGLTMITQFQRRALGALTPPETFFRSGKVLST
ncbi:SPOSA6832_03585, partial [Sporobolomyces salmonicolor]